MRLFVAVRPPAEVLDHLELALSGLRGGAGPSASLRWTVRENWHLTAAFYGEVPEGTVPALADGLAELVARRAPWSLHLRGAGVFAHRTVWVGVGGDVETQAALSAEAVELGEGLGTWSDARERHRPHLTVGRVRPGPRPTGRGGPSGSRGGHGGGSGGALGGPAGGPRRGRARADADPTTDVVRALAVYAGPAWTVDTVLLVRSRPGEGRSGGPLYEDVASFPVAGDEGPGGPHD
ncbi:RNA 2',3'-cyclic phosphodiesterase [Cellulomonas marina]|uniref:RNA 2',3'-cyclic phosphodiesterase n=1 Tax=Cellulomonas marina TaxID=988821 RepID=A0A1I0VMN9_9CELL|nr:RNA 2',3'-cyclic phosphodiesterase [Cellulomonas marina]GIG27876.1 RNA 2',3'-cyclic phosphodiesterase [Cellulomonas marina]SFA77602.1 2'-5' RNA ligase [Cellulomonas marina]